MKNRYTALYSFSYVLILLIVVLLSLSCAKKPADITIAIQPFKGFPVKQSELVSQNIHANYGFKTFILPAIPLPKDAFINVKSPRYRADKLIHYLKSIKPDSIDYILALTQKDISTTKYQNGEVKQPSWKYEDWGICGLGYLTGPTCIVSTFRIKHHNTDLFLDRLKKLSSHELGHNLGLHHCNKNTECVMKDAAESVSTIDGVKNNLCNQCKKKID